ncbi:hypothetical protein FW774_13780 [Pedobacter sp. BS3]|uniref:hypothetical protein n=1 Tax=Pedobacter sp. BS3 TaxID=2567937 RepID=UPI0011ED0943|nr:hypothetical protein [Pedobacter sp. BS3]TZF82574.1 hypothetical protein FW774_13780 [Pedobacter sp. BS3]
MSKTARNNKSEPHYSISLSFEEIKLPPFHDILVVGKYSPQGKHGLSRSFDLLIPNGFEMFEVKNEYVEAVFINKKILRKIPHTKIIDILSVKVFPFIAEGELLKVDFKIAVSFSNIEQSDI